MVLSVVDILQRFHPLVLGDQVCVLARKATHHHFTWAIGVVSGKPFGSEGACVRFRTMSKNVIVDLTSEDLDVEEILYHEEFHTFSEHFGKAGHWTSIGANTHRVVSTLRSERVYIDSFTFRKGVQEFIETSLPSHSRGIVLPAARSVMIGLFPSSVWDYLDGETEWSAHQFLMMIGLLLLLEKRHIRTLTLFLDEEESQKRENPWHSPLNVAFALLAKKCSNSNSSSSISRSCRTPSTTGSEKVDWLNWSERLAPIFRLNRAHRKLLKVTDRNQLNSMLSEDEPSLGPIRKSFILVWHYLRDRTVSKLKTMTRRRERQRERQRSAKRHFRREQRLLSVPVSLRDVWRIPRHLSNKAETVSVVSSWLRSGHLLNSRATAPRPLTCTPMSRVKRAPQAQLPALDPAASNSLSLSSIPLPLGGYLWEGPLPIDDVLSCQEGGCDKTYVQQLVDDKVTCPLSGIGARAPAPISESLKDLSFGPQPSLCVRALTWQVIPMIKSVYFSGISPTSTLEIKLISLWQVGTRFSTASRKQNGMSAVSHTMLSLFGIDLSVHGPDPRTSPLTFSEPSEPSPSTPMPTALPEKDEAVDASVESMDSQSHETNTVSTSFKYQIQCLRMQRQAADTSTPEVCRTIGEYMHNELVKAENFYSTQRRDRNRIPLTNPAFPWQRKLRMSYEGEPDIAIHNGYDPGGGFHVDGVHPVTKRNNDLVMYKTTDNILDLKKLSEDSPLLRETLLPLLDTKIFEETMFLPDQPPIKGKRRLSRGMLKHLPTLLECDHAELAPAEVEILDYLGCFLVEKKDGSGRFIGNCRPLNARQVVPGPMGLPPIQAVIRQILTWSYASQCDGKSFFCQFELAEGIRKHFACRLADMRGKIVTILLKRMPMGWSHAPRIAQAVANHIMEDIGVGWVDNFIFGAETEEKFIEKRELLRSRLKRYNLEVDDLAMEMTQSLFCLGLEFDLKQHRYRLDPKWIEKRATVFKYTASIQDISFRQFFELVGSLIWASYVTDEPLWMHAETLAALSQLAKVVQDKWDDKCEVPEYAYRDIQKWVDQVTQNCWCGSPHSERGSVEESAGGVRKPSVFSDASDFGAAWVRIVESSMVAGQQWHRDPSVDGNIFMGELDALLQAFQANEEDEGYAVDNLGLRLAVKKGHSSSYEANVKLREVFGRRWPKVWWISTHVNIADPFSRGVIIPPFSEPARLENWVVYDDGSGDNLSESSKILSDFPNFPEWKKLKPF